MKTRNGKILSLKKMKLGKLHSVDGPAVIKVFSSFGVQHVEHEYYINGIEKTKDEFLRELRNIKLKEL
jgi:hypothetical protein